MCSTIGASEKEKGEIESIEKKSFSFEVFFIFFRVEIELSTAGMMKKFIFIAVGEFQWLIQGKLKEIRHSCKKKMKKIPLRVPIRGDDAEKKLCNLILNVE